MSESNYLICLNCDYVFTEEEGREQGKKIGEFPGIHCPSCLSPEYAECAYSKEEIQHQLEFQRKIKEKGAVLAIMDLFSPDEEEEYEEDETTLKIRKNVKCCACGGSMESSKHINLVALGKLATWKYPAVGNILTGEPAIQACAVLCDNCLEEKREAKFAVEWNNDYEVKYHPVDKLADYHVERG